jgi:polar amino acid transport system substrate-binding protein
MRKLFNLTLIAAFTLIAIDAKSEGKTYKIGTFPIPLMVENGNAGVFIELAKELAKRSNIKLEITLDSTKRTLSAFKTGQIIGFFPALDTNLPKKAEVSSEIYIKKDFGFVLKPNSAPKSIFDLKGKTIGLTAGYPYVSEITRNPSFRIDYANTDSLNVKKLIHGRNDVFVVEERSGLRAFEKEKVMSQVAYDPNYPLSQQKVFFAFQPGAEGRELAKKFSKALEATKKDGTFQRIMKKAG